MNREIDPIDVRETCQESCYLGSLTRFLLLNMGWVSKYCYPLVIHLYVFIDFKETQNNLISQFTNLKKNYNQICNNPEFVFISVNTVLSTRRYILHFFSDNILHVPKSLTVVWLIIVFSGSRLFVSLCKSRL